MDENQGSKVSKQAETTVTGLEISDLVRDLKRSTIEDSYELIDTVEAVSAVIANLIDQPTQPPSLYIDLEGINLSRQGTVSILQIYVASLDKSYLIDIFTLGSKAFNSKGKKDFTLRSVLESESIPKVFFDVRNDSDALFSHFNVSLAGVVDLQVMEYASRTYKGRFVSGLSKCMEKDLNIPMKQKLELKQVKDKGARLFAPEKGGTYEVFNERPLSTDIALYCVQDVKWLPHLHGTYSRKLSIQMSVRVSQATNQRVKDSQSASYLGHGKHKAIGPWVW